MKTCPNCNGKGSVPSYEWTHHWLNGWQKQRKMFDDICSKCKGTGKIEDKA